MKPLKVILIILGTLVFLFLIFALIGWGAAAQAKTDAATKLGGAPETTPLDQSALPPVVNSGPTTDATHPTQKQDQSLWGDIEQWWNKKFHAKNKYVQVPPIDSDGIDANGFDADGFLVRP